MCSSRCGRRGARPPKILEPAPSPIRISRSRDRGNSIFLRERSHPRQRRPSWGLAIEDGCDRQGEGDVVVWCLVRTARHHCPADHLLPRSTDGSVLARSFFRLPSDGRSPRRGRTVAASGSCPRSWSGTLLEVAERSPRIESAGTGARARWRPNGGNG